MSRKKWQPSELLPRKHRPASKYGWRFVDITYKWAINKNSVR
jgi:hypothetical protein